MWFWKGKSKYDRCGIEISNWGLHVVEPLHSISAQLWGNLGLSSIFPKGQRVKDSDQPCGAFTRRIGKTLLCFPRFCTCLTPWPKRTLKKNSAKNSGSGNWEERTIKNALLKSKNPKYRNQVEEQRLFAVWSFFASASIFCKDLILAPVSWSVPSSNMCFFSTTAWKGGRHRRVSIGTTAVLLRLLSHLLRAPHIIITPSSFIYWVCSLHGIFRIIILRVLLRWQQHNGRRRFHTIRNWASTFRAWHGTLSRVCRRVTILIRAVAGHHLRLLFIIFTIVRFRILGRQAGQLVGEVVVKQKGKRSVQKIRTV